MVLNTGYLAAWSKGLTVARRGGLDRWREKEKKGPRILAGIQGQRRIEMLLNPFPYRVSNDQK